MSKFKTPTREVIGRISGLIFLFSENIHKAEAWTKGINRKVRNITP